MNSPVIHIVKRFGRVGGMESYVWHLVHGLAERGIEINVVCERVCEPPRIGIRIIEVESAPERPRWKSMMTFRLRADQKIRQKFRGEKVLIHSHERSLSHQVTTFHGPPIGQPVGIAWFTRFNRRIAAWQQMERDELFGPNVEMILVVSGQIQRELLARHPNMIERKSRQAWPGVVPSNFVTQQSNYKCSSPLKVLFVGKEWKRKGLDIAVRIVEKLRKSRAEVALTVYGVEYRQLPAWIKSLGWIEVKGWSSDIPWSDFDVLLHPARNEPFGMVVAEARTHGVPVVMSMQVGAADLQFAETIVLDDSKTLSDWAKAILELVEHSTREPEVKWTWDDLVAEHIDMIYPQVRPLPL